MFCLPQRKTEKPAKWLNKFKSGILESEAKAVSRVFILHLDDNHHHHLSLWDPKTHIWDGRGREMHTQIKVALGSPPLVPTDSAPGSAHPCVYHRFSIGVMGASPAGLSAAIFPPQLRFFPVGGVASTPAAELAAVLDLGRRVHSGSGPLGSGPGEWTDRGLRK